MPDPKRLLKFMTFNACVVLVLCIGGADYLTEESVSIAFFYLIPISLASWFVGRGAGISVALLSAFIWFIVDFFISSGQRHPMVAYWNGVMEMGFFLVNAILLSFCRKFVEKERRSARIDELTGALNRHAFYESVNLELSRAKRYKYPLTIGFIDLDNFKVINDKFGHHTGDEVLSSVAHTIQNNTRANDILARIGGDEFVLLLPGVNIENSKMIFSKIRDLIAEPLQDISRITASIGAVTFVKIPDSVEDLLRKTDAAMYSVKNSIKGGVNYEILEK